MAGASAEDATERRLRILEQELRRAQQEIKELKGQIKQQNAMGQATQKQAEDAQLEAKAATAKAEKGGTVADWVGRTTLFGDVRFRHEGFYNQPHAEGQSVTARNRERIRARVGVKVAFSDEISGTVRERQVNRNGKTVTFLELSGNPTYQKLSAGQPRYHG